MKIFLRTAIFLPSLFSFIPQSFAQVHDKAHWIGEIYEGADKKYEIRDQHLLRGTTLPEPTCS